MEWRNPATRAWEIHPVMLAARAYIESLPGPICLVVTDQTAVLGLEDVGPLGGHPVMVGKAKINASAGRFTALPVSIDSTDDHAIVAITSYLAQATGVRAVNLEDITGKGGRCFRVQRELQRLMSIPIFHDDQDGTAIITLAGLMVALEDQGKELSEVSVVISGAGAAGIKIARFLLVAGVRGERLVMLDSAGILSPDRPDLRDLDLAQQEKRELLQQIRSDLQGALARGDETDREAAAAADRRRALRGADVFLGMSVANILTVEHLRSMADRPVVFACANPDPEISFAEATAARTDLIFGSGSSLYPNQINNAVAFPGLLAGLMLSGARRLDIEAGVAAAGAIARRTRQLRSEAEGFCEVVPKVVDPELHLLVARATAQDVFARGLDRDDGPGEPALDEAAAFAEIDRRFRRS